MVLHVKYPSMERQDLSQSQLGAFKFTPVDEEPRSFHQPLPHPMLLDQYNQSLRNGGFGSHLTSPEIAADPSFFNNQIKPHLDNSRLRLGPAAVRAAVERASTSPHKQASFNSRDFGPPTNHIFHPHLKGSSENDSMGSMWTDGQSGLTSNSSGCSIGFPSANNSLLRALESEQEAHEITKSHLEHESNVRKDAEAETQRLTEHNKSLLNSIKLLQSTVKHMVHQQESEKSDKRSSEDVKNDTNESKEQAERKVVANSILYDVLANYKVPQTTLSNGKESTHFINLDLLNTPDANDFSEKAQLQRTLRRQIGLSSGPDSEEKSPNAKYQENIQAIVTANNLANKDSAQKVTNSGVQQAPKSEPSSVVSIVQTPINQTQTVGSFEKLFPELPSTFLAKYGKRSASPVDQSDDSGHIITPRRSTLTATLPIRSREGSKDNIPPCTVTEMPESIALNWRVDGRHADELRGILSQTKTDNYFREHPIRFVPKFSDQNLFRTIMIDFIPYGTPYCDVLSEIRGGTVESVQLYGPIGCATDFVTARVVFTHELAAVGLDQRGQSPGITINGKRVRVWRVLEPTYPKNKELEEDIYQNGHTRILIVNAPIDNVDQVLKRKLLPQINQGLVLDIGRSYDGVPIVEFTSIEEATKALHVLLKDNEFAGSDFDFDEDYCAAKYV